MVDNSEARLANTALPLDRSGKLQPSAGPHLSFHDRVAVLEARIAELETENKRLKDEIQTAKINRFVLQPNHEVIAVGSVFKIKSRAEAAP